MADDRTKTKRSSLPRIETKSTAATAWQEGSPGAEKKGQSSQPEQSRPQSLEDRILNSVASSLSISPSRLRESLASKQDDNQQTAGSVSLRKQILGDDLIIKTKVISGSQTIADVETQVVQPTSAHSMAASLVEPETEGSDLESGSETEIESEEEEEEKEKESTQQAENVEEYDDDSSSDDDVDMRSASVMIAPEKIHRASRMDSTRLRAGRQDFDKHVRMPSWDDAPPIPMNPLDKPGEIELFLGSENAVSKVVVLRPRAGLFEDKLVACLTLSSIPPKEPDSPKVELISSSQIFFAGTQIATIKQNLRSTTLVDAKAIPEVWIPLDSMPTVAETDQVDRRKLRTWVQNANQDIFERVMSLSTDQPLQQATTDMERAVQKLIARVLQVPPDQVGMNFTFTQLGGDEVTAMALVTNARVESIFLESHEILHPNSTFGYLAVLATQRGGLAHKWTADQEKIVADGPVSPTTGTFDLSPMQKLYFSTKMGGDAKLRRSADGSYRFNSSLLFRVAKGLGVHEISAATDALVGHHAMLRARFVKVKDEWMQQILPTVEGSYSFMHYTISTNQQVESVVHNTQSTIDVEDGPVFAVAHFQTTDGHQMIYLAAHHLVVDVASWRLIIHDLDELLQHGTLLSQRAMPFQKWIELQKMDTQVPCGGLPFDICPGDLGYWGLQDSTNAYADAEEVSFSLSQELTSILETTCNQVLRTESADIYISALLLSFAQTFPDRRVPDVWNQEHGRDLWSDQIDISETVGWFTTLCPLSQQINASSDFVDVLRRLKDTRRAVPHRGAHYFASKFFSNEKTPDPGSPRPSSPSFLQIATRDWPIEILFSYAGNIKNLGKDNGVLEQMVLPGRTLEARTSDIGPAVGRIAMFEVNTTVDQGSAKIKFLYNRHSKNLDRITAWIQNYEHLLLEAIGRLRFADPELTLSDIPQLWATGVTYEGLAKLNRTVVTELGLGGVNEIEAVYPVTPMQQSILVSQARQLQFPAGPARSHCEENGYSYMPSTSSNGNANACHIHVMYELASPNGAPVDLARVVAAWDQVTARYPALRTVFIESVAEQGLFNAVVLRRWNPNMLFLDATPSEDPADTLNNLPPLTAYPALKSVPRHRLTVCHSPMKTVVKLDVSAALCDMISVNNLIADLRRGYCTGRVLPAAASEGEIFSYSGYLDVMRGLDRERSIAWWKDALANITQPCLFPKLDFYYGGEHKDPTRPRRYDSVHAEITDVVFQKVADFCRLHKTTTGTVLRLAWGLVLRAITGSNAVCFGYRATGRSATLEGMRTAIGCFSNTIAVSFDLSSFKPLGILLRQIEDGYNAALPHQHITMAEVRHALSAYHKGAAVDAQLFNTCFAFSEEPADLSSSFPGRDNLELRNVMNHETTDYDLTINTRFSSTTGRLIVDIGHSTLSETQAHNIANTIGRAVSTIIKCASPSVPIGFLDLFSDRDYAQVVNWTNQGDKDNQQQRTLLHELVFAQIATRPESKAVCAHDGDLTYREIEFLSRRLAHKLLEAGVVPRGSSKAAVPVILDKSIWAPIALLAVLKAGAAFVPVDADEMGFVSKIAEQLGPASKVALACANAAEALATNSKPLFDRVICLDDTLMKELKDETPVPGQLLPPTSPEDIACVFFTPTSSRSVRGISFTHAALSTCFRAQGPACGINNTTRVLQLSSFNVDVALSEVFTTLVNGGAMCIPTSRDRYNDYTGCVTRFSASWSYMTPLLARKLDVDLLPTLKTVCFRTRGLDEDTYAPWRGRKRVVMAYGAPDVCPLGISFLEIHGPHHLRAIGRPIAGSAWIVSCEDHRNLMPVGAVGEMVVEGPTLGKTFRASSLTGEDESKDIPETPASPESRENFVAANTNNNRGHQKYPSISTIASDEPGSQGKKRYYKTGHSVRYIEGGLMELVSSKRDDLEIDGRVVNLADLEQHIRRALGQGVDVMVEALEFKGERGRAPTLAAFLELGGDAESSGAALHSLNLANLGDEVKQRVHIAKQLVDKALRGTVPDCMIPKIFIPVRHLPTTYSLKVNRRKLQKVIKGMSREQLLELATVQNAEQVTEVHGSRPVRMGGMEEQVRAVWARVLKVDENSIGSTDGFMKLGGDEILAAEVLAQCRKEKLLVTVTELMRDMPLAEICRSNRSYSLTTSQAITTASTLDKFSEPGNTLNKALDSAIASIQQQAHVRQEAQPQPPPQPQPQRTSVSVAASTPAPQIIDKTFIDETLAPKLLLEPEVIRDVAEATSTQIRHVETAILAQGLPRSSNPTYGPSLASVNYFVFHFTAASSTSSVSARRIEDVCQILASIHPILRTAFVPHVEGQNRKLYQVVVKNHNVDFKHIPRVQGWRLGATLEKEVKKDRERLLNEHDLFYRPFTKFIFLDAGKTSTLVLRLSRAQYDDLSIALLVKDLKKLYDGGQNPPRRPGFADFVREAALANVGGEAERYWKGLLEGSAPTQVVRHGKPPKLSSSVRTLRESVSVNTTSMSGLGIQFDTVLKAAWGMVLATISGTPDVVFGEVVEGCHSRLQHHLGPSSVNRGGVLGPTSTVLPVRIRFADSPTSPLHLLKCVADQRADGVPYENLGMLDIVEKCTPWPYWTRMSTVVQHRTDPELLADGKAKSFRLGAALCKMSVIESDWADTPDFLVRSVARGKAGADVGEVEKQAIDVQRGRLREGDEELEVSVSFCEQRVPANLAHEVLNKLCGYVGLLTGFSMMQNVVPTATQYASYSKQIPLTTPMFGNSPTMTTTTTSGVPFNNPFGGGAIKVNYAQIEAKMTPEQITTIQSTIEDAWRSTLDPRTLGVPEEHVTTAAFYDLWGSLIPAAQLAEYLTDEIPMRLVAELATNLFAGNLDGFRITMDEIVENPTMLSQFELIVRKAFGGEGRDRSLSIKHRSNSIPHSVRKSNSLTNLANTAVRKNSTASSQSGVGAGNPARAGTVSLHGPSKLGHSRTQSGSTENTVASSNDESPAMGSKPLFPAHPAVKPPVNNQSTSQLALRAQQQHSRKNSDTSNASNTSYQSVTAATAPRSVSNTPPTSIGSPDPSELPGSAAHHLIKRSTSIRSGEAGPESPVLGNLNLVASPPVVQTGFVAARKKTNFGIGSSLRRMASNALRPGVQNHSTSNSHSNGSVKMLQPPKSSGSDMSWTSHRDKDGKEQQQLAPPVSPWMRVQSMAPQLPPFSPFTPVTEDAFSLAESANTSSDGQRTGPSPDLSQGRTSRGTSPDLILQHRENRKSRLFGRVEDAPPFMERISGTLVMDENGELMRATSIDSSTEGDSGLELDNTEGPEQEADEDDEERTLRPEKAQKLLMSSVQLQQTRQSPEPAQMTRQQVITQQQEAQPSPSPVTETFYMEDDEGSEAEDVIDQGQYDSLEELESAPATPRQWDSRPVTMIHSPQLDGPTTRTSGGGPQPNGNNKRKSTHQQERQLEQTSPQTSPRYSVFPRSSMSAPPLPSWSAAGASGNNAANNNNKSKRAAPGPAAGTDFQDFASLEAAEMDDVVSPLTPVERAMLYKQQGFHRNNAGGGQQQQQQRMVMGSLTPGSYFPQQQQQQGVSQMGGFHAI